MTTSKRNRMLRPALVKGSERCVRCPRVILAGQVAYENPQAFAGYVCSGCHGADKSFRSLALRVASVLM